MKKTIFVFCMLMLTFVNSKAQQQVEPRQSAAPEKKNAVLVSGGACADAFMRAAEPGEKLDPVLVRTVYETSLSPTIDHMYRQWRLLAAISPKFSCQRDI